MRRKTGRDTLMVEHEEPTRDGARHFFHLPLAGRVVGLDLLRGGAIAAMTMYHQSLVVRPVGGWESFAQFLGFISAPLFLCISGMGASFHERRHHRPFKMVVHGGLLFAFAYLLDLLVNRNARVEWDIFQIIGACYGGLGLLGCLGYGVRQLAGMAGIFLALLLFPAFRPDQGFFPPWPFGLYFAAGYLLSRLGQSPWLSRWMSLLLTAASLSYFLYWLSLAARPDDRAQPAGFFFLVALVYVLLTAALDAEKRDLFRTGGLKVLVRWGQYPLTLYLFQQVVTIARVRLPLPAQLPPAAAWVVQSAALLSLMYAATFLLERFPFLDAGWWLRQAEARVLSHAPAKAAPGQN